MKYLKSLLILCFSLTVMMMPMQKAHAEMDARMKALSSMALYGTVGGALLGTASLAFGTSGRSIAIGASLGLYAGIIFGSYIVISHAMRKSRQMNPQPQDNYYPDTTSPYEDGNGDSGDPDPYADPGAYNQPWDLLEEKNLSELAVTAQLTQSELDIPKENKIYYLELVRYQF